VSFTFAEVGQRGQFENIAADIKDFEAVRVG
jgi:hypothetical protein